MFESKRLQRASEENIQARHTEADKVGLQYEQITHSTVTIHRIADAAITLLDGAHA